MTSILEGLRGVVTPALVSSVSAQTGESDAAVAKGLAALLPTFLSSIADRSNDAGFMTQMAKLATGAANVPVSLGTEYGANSPGNWSTAGSSLLSGLFGSRLSSVTDSIAGYSGVRRASATSLLTVTAPLVLGYLGRLMTRDSLDATGLGRKLRDERQSLASALPAGLSGALPGSDSMAAVTALQGGAERDQTGTRWALPLVLAGLALAGLLWFSVRDRGQSIGTLADRSVGSALGGAQSAVAAVKRTLPGNIDLQVFPGSLEDRLISYLTSPSAVTGVFAFDRIGFETGSPSLTPESREQLSNVAAILKSYPSATVMIEGHTDNVGDEAANMRLSTTRAIAVRDALRTERVSNSLDARGYGSTSPIADNVTETGRAANRRVSLRISPPRAR